MSLKSRCIGRLLALGLLFGLVTVPALADDFLPPEQAFVFSATTIDAKTVRLHWVIAPGYHLYRDRLSVQSDVPEVKWSPLVMPKGKEQFDPNFDKTMTIYERALDIDLHFTQGGAAMPISVGWQGCADAGLCYPPDTAQITVALSGFGAPQNKVTLANPAAAFSPPSALLQKLSPGANALSSTTNASADPASSGAAQSSGAAAGSSLDSITTALASGSLLHTLFVFWLGGLLLAFTPCVLPMVPILSSLIAGQKGHVSRLKGFQLALTYSLGMALVYAGFGVAAGLAGEGLAAALQNVWVLGAFAALLIILSLSMFGFYELQLPSALQNRAANWSNRFQGGSFVGVFLMGGISALVVGPCVAAPLAGALVYISQTRDVVLGGLALFIMALGMSVPLLLVGLSAGSLLPRTGSWMERVKHVFGMLLVATAIWMVTPVLPVVAQMLLWSAWLMIAAALLGLFGSAPPQQSSQLIAARTLGAILAAMALLVLIGAASGGQSILQPLAHLRADSNVNGGSKTSARNALPFEPVTSIAALDSILEQAQQQGQPVMLDFYADWCVACKEFENFTFTHPQVRERLSKVRLLRADVTANNADDKALLKRFGLFGPPGILFFDRETSPRVRYQVIGYQNADAFLQSLTAAGIP